MSVLKNLQKLSIMEFYKEALEIRKEVSMWLMRDFGYKKNARNVKAVIKNMEEQDVDTINEIYKKYGYSINKEFNSEFDYWYIESEKYMFNRLCQELMYNITMANSIYPKSFAEYELRVSYQDKAIGNCYNLFSEISSVKGIFNTNLNFLSILLERISREIDLLKAWRLSSNKHKPIE